MPMQDENGNTVSVEFARLNDRDNDRVVLEKLKYGLFRDEAGTRKPGATNIGYLSTQHIDEVIYVSEEYAPYHTPRDTSANHQWLDQNGWLHRTATVMNVRNGALYDVKLSIAKTEDGRLIYYTDEGNMERVGTAPVNSVQNAKALGLKPTLSQKLTQKKNGVNPQNSVRVSEKDNAGYMALTPMPFNACRRLLSKL